MSENYRRWTLHASVCPIITYDAIEFIHAIKTVVSEYQVT